MLAAEEEKAREEDAKNHGVGGAARGVADAGQAVIEGIISTPEGLLAVAQHLEKEGNPNALLVMAAQDTAEDLNKALNCQNSRECTAAITMAMAGMNPAGKGSRVVGKVKPDSKKTPELKKKDKQEKDGDKKEKSEFEADSENIPDFNADSGGEEFSDWFDNLSEEEFLAYWNDEKSKDKIKTILRKPGGFHEWFMVSRADKAKSLGISPKEVWSFRTKVKDLKWINPKTGRPGKHGGHGSTTFHNELGALIDNSKNIHEFNAGLIELSLRWNIPNLPKALKK